MSQIILKGGQPKIISAQIFSQVWCDFFLLHNMHEFPEIKGKYVELLNSM